MKGKILFTQPLEVRQLMLQLKAYNYRYQDLSPIQNNNKFCNKSTNSSFTISSDSWVTDRKPVNTGNEYQLYLGSVSNINVPLY